MLIPIRHEHMSARRWPVITFALIAINVAVFLFTHGTMQEQARPLGVTKAHILMLAAMHPELTVSGDAQQLVDGFREHNAGTWKRLGDQTHDLEDGWDARIRLTTEPAALQAEMDSLCEEYAKLEAESLTEQYAFIPARPKLLSYLTANFLHGGWLHLIGNMWFLWLAGFVLEDVWGRPLYTVFYLLAGAAALQFYAWTNAGSMIPTVGASGAVAALMGAFLVRFPNMKIEMAWLFMFRAYRFKAPAYWLLPLWLAMEVFYGSLLGQSSGVAHWAHVGGFLAGALAAVCLRYSGWEQKANEAIEEKVTWTVDPVIDEATALLDKGQLEEAGTLLKAFSARNPESTDACSLLGQVYWRQNQVEAYHEVIARLCGLHLKARAPEAAWQDYEDF
ncbi:MAG: rhomboid family intramembrane serine protease, partial [Acidobacteriaceae bacterium]|nr:rhomboid family intramembrane serine protease [Acidobacteriaceae bacterium]